MDRLAFDQSARSLGLNLSDDQLDRFQTFEDALYQANQVMNLTRVAPEECWFRHFIDSLLPQFLFPEGSTVLDLGTGPGFPAWPLACARPDLKVTALDSNGKMLGFLRNQPLPNLEIVQARAEEWPVREEFDIVTGRAVAPLAIQLEISAGFCRLGGKVIPLRTPTDDFMPAGAGILGLRLGTVHELPLPQTDIIRAFPVYEKRSATHKRYPRRWAEIKAVPLW